MLRALSTRRGHHNHGYDKLSSSSEDKQPLFDNYDPKLKRVSSVPSSRQFGSLNKSPEPSFQTAAYPAKKAAGKSHPLLGFFESKSSKKRSKMTDQQFVRYLNYVKEGGSWDPKTNRPVIYYK